MIGTPSAPVERHRKIHHVQLYASQKKPSDRRRHPARSTVEHTADEGSYGKDDPQNHTDA